MVGFGNLGDLGNLGNLAQNAVKNFDKSNNDKPADQQQQQQQQQPNNTSANTWTEIGSETKKAVTAFQEKQSKGDKPNYEDVGNVAKKAYGAYGKEGDADATTIGKSIVQGFMSGGKAEDRRPQEQERRDEEPRP